MKALVLALSFVASASFAQAREIQALDCLAANGLKFTFDSAAEDKAVAVSFGLAKRSYGFTKKRVDVVNGIVGFTLAQPVSVLAGVVETYQIDLKVDEEKALGNEFTGLGVVTKTVINLLAPVPVTSLPVGIHCAIAVK